ncbi:MAG: excinuclease ABC subunit UvrC [Ruminococcaceae bacterium]|nr:excinuclease ABC subunit UvrC [Oscillospiraceae bacterium]
MKEYIPQRLSFETLLEKAKSLPLRPGIYLFFDSRGEIIYVGKSRALKNRVLSYFQNVGRHPPKTEKLVRTVRDFQTIVTADEREALILENEKIKLHKPKFNIRLKDDKDYPYVRLSVGDAYPRLSFAHRKEKKGDTSRYFGPFSSSGAVRVAIDTANKIFQLPTCRRKFPQEIGKGRPCLYYQMGRCIGVCTGKVTPEEYARRLEDVILFFKNDNKKIVSSLEQEMTLAAENMEFERAASIRDRIRALTSLSGKKQVVKDLHFHADVFGFFADDLGGCINLLSVREGRVADSTNYHFGADEILSAESFSSFLFSLYRGREFLPKKILVPKELWSEELSVLSENLSSEESKVRFHLPERGEGRALLTMANENAEAAARHRRAMFERDEAVLVSLASLLSLEVFPQRIESIDISNSGTSSVYAGVIAVENARFLKKAYKSFSIDLEHPDDTACMYEAITRRVKRYLDGDEAFAPLPDLILVDGSAGQVHAVNRALSELGVSIPVFGMVKDAFHKTRCLTDGEREISIAFDPAVFQFIYGIQEEVHRFSLSRMDAKRRKSVKRSVLCDINGIGEKKAAALMKHFKSLRAVKEAETNALASVSGISQKDAESIYQHFRNQE